MARTKVTEKKKKRKKNEHGQNYIASPTGIANNNSNADGEYKLVLWKGKSEDREKVIRKLYCLRGS